MMTQTSNRCLETWLSDTGSFVRFVGTKVRLGNDHLRILEENLDHLLNETSGDAFILDLNNIDTIASSALGRFAVIQQKVAERGKDFRVVEVYPHVYEIFEASRLVELFDIRPVAIGTSAREEIPLEK